MSGRLRSDVIKLAHEHPELRAALLPILASDWSAARPVTTEDMRNTLNSLFRAVAGYKPVAAKKELQRLEYQLNSFQGPQDISRLRMLVEADLPAFVEHIEGLQEERLQLLKKLKSLGFPF